MPHCNGGVKAASTTSKDRLAQKLWVGTEWVLIGSAYLYRLVTSPF